MNNNSIIGNTYKYLTVLRRVGDHDRKLDENIIEQLKQQVGC